MKKMTKLSGMSLATMGILTVGLMADEPMMPTAEPEVPATEPMSPSADAPAAEKEAYQDTSDKSVVAIADGDKNFTTLVTALRAAELVEALNGDGPYTIFAPTNEAFEKLPEGALADLLKPENKEKLTAILKYHVIPGKVMAAKMMPSKIATLEGHEFEVKKEGDTVMVNHAKVTRTDIIGKNGVIHVIDAVIMPPEMDEGTQEEEME